MVAADLESGGTTRRRSCLLRIVLHRPSTNGTSTTSTTSTTVAASLSNSTPGSRTPAQPEMPAQVPRRPHLPPPAPRTSFRCSERGRARGSRRRRAKAIAATRAIRGWAVTTIEQQHDRPLMAPSDAGLRAVECELGGRQRRARGSVRTRCWSGSRCPWNRARSRPSSARLAVASRRSFGSSIGCTSSSPRPPFRDRSGSTMSTSTGRRPGDRDAAHDRHGLPATEPVPFDDHRPERALGSRLSGTKVAQSRCTGPGVPRAGRTVAGGQNRLNEAGGGALGWSTAASVHRPGSGGPTQGAPDGRAVFGPRPHLDRVSSRTRSGSSARS